MNNDLKKSLKKVSSFIDGRYQKLGRSIGTVGWGSVESQELRFKQIFKEFDLKNKTILDIGCGLGDLYGYLSKNVPGSFKYIGIDISRSVIEDAKKKYNETNAIFYHGSLEELQLEKVDITVVSGTFSYRFDGVKEYSKETLNRMFQISRVGISANFLSLNCDYQLAKNQHYDPLEVLGWGLGLSEKVTLNHDYGLYEFTISIKH